MGLWWLIACIDGVTQVAGVGAVYTTKCSAVMDVHDDMYTARCDPPSCEPRFQDAGTSHVVVDVVPEQKVVGYAERTCLQDLSAAASRFAPMLDAAPAAPPADEPAPIDPLKGGGKPPPWTTLPADPEGPS